MIPPITDPLGKYWRQPDLTSLDVQGTHAILSREEFDGLAEYSTSRPSGVYPGKAWKGQGRAGQWWLIWYGESSKGPGYCSTNSLPIVVASSCGVAA